MRSNTAQCPEEKFKQLVEHYRSCNHLVLKLNELQKKFNDSDKTVCLDKLYKKHLFEAYWTDIGGEA